MNSQSPADIAEDWICAWSGTEPPTAGPHQGGSCLDWELPRNDPALCLESIVQVLGRIDRASSSHLLAALAAGPLEDLLVENGLVVVEQVEVLARRSAEFRFLLNGVWDSTIKPDVLARLAKYRNQRW